MLAVASVAALAVAGCGGDDESTSESNTGLSYDGYISELDSLCTSVEGDIKPDSDKLTGEAANDAKVLPAIIRKVEDANKRFTELEPPEELKPAADKFAANNEESLTATEDAAAAAKTGDQQAYEAELEEIQKLDKAGEKISVVEIGANDCAS